MWFVDCSHGMHAFQTELASSVAVINTAISVQLLFKGGHNSAYTRIDSQLAI